METSTTAQQEPTTSGSLQECPAARRSKENSKTLKPMISTSFNEWQLWLKFFRSAGIRPPFDTSYALVFEMNHIQMDLMPFLNEEILTDMKITSVNDVNLILEHARQISGSKNQESKEDTEDELDSKNNNSASTADIIMTTVPVSEVSVSSSSSPSFSPCSSNSKPLHNTNTRNEDVASSSKIESISRINRTSNYPINTKLPPPPPSSPYQIKTDLREGTTNSRYPSKYEWWKANVQHQRFDNKEDETFKTSPRSDSFGIYEDYGSRYSCKSAKISRRYDGPPKLDKSFFL